MIASENENGEDGDESILGGGSIYLDKDVMGNVKAGGRGGAG